MRNDQILDAIGTINDEAIADAKSLSAAKNQTLDKMGRYGSLCVPARYWWNTFFAISITNHHNSFGIR